LYEDAPNISLGLNTAMASAVNFLASKIPRPPSQLLLSQEWKPSNAQKQDFMTYYKAVNQPLSALKDLKSGTLLPQTMEALQVTQPHLLQEMRSKVMEHLNPKKAQKLSYPVKMSLSLFMGQPLEEGLIPSVIASNQVSFAGPQQSQQSAPKKRNSTLGGLKELNMASRASTETEDLEEDEA
jgi:hypothetical protein